MDWARKYSSLCDAPLEAIEKGTRDEDHPAIVFSHYWNDLNGGTMPLRSAVRPKDIISILKWIMILERKIKNGLDEYFVRLQGTSLVRLTHMSGTGQFLHDFTSGACYSSRLQAIRSVIKAGKPGFGKAIPGEGGEYSIEVGAGSFPFFLGDHGIQVFMIAAPIKRELRPML